MQEKMVEKTISLPESYWKIFEDDAQRFGQTVEERIEKTFAFLIADRNRFIQGSTKSKLPAE